MLVKATRKLAPRSILQELIAVGLTRASQQRERKTLLAVLLLDKQWEGTEETASFQCHSYLENSYVQNLLLSLMGN